jgi:DNA-binding beta-propeller fold protein YncE
MALKSCRPRVRLASSGVGLLVALIAAPALAVEVAARINTPYPTGVEVEFAANAVGTGEITFTWDFGDGTQSEPSTEGTATHVYAQPGHYSVIVVARDESGVRSQSFLQAVHRPLPARPPTASSTIVFDRGRNRVCNVNADNDTVSCISAETFALEFETPVGDHPRTLAVSQDGTIWVVNQDDASVSVLDQNGTLLHTIVLPRGCKPFGIAMNATRGVAYVTLQGTGQLAELDLSNGAIRRLVTAGPSATGVSVDPSGDRIFVTRFISPLDRGEVVELSAESLSLARTIALITDPGPDTEASSRGVPNYLRQVSVSPDGAFAWVPSKKDNTERGAALDGEALTFETSVRTIISYIDLVDNQETFAKRFDFNNRSLGLSVAFSPIGDYAFLGLMGNNAVEVFDAYDSRIVSGSFGVGKAPDGLVLDDAGHLFVNAFMSRSVVVLDAVGILTSTNFALDVITEVSVSQQEKLDPEVLLGKQIFYDAEDPRMGRAGYISCAVCHLDGFEDGRTWDFTDRGEGLRNTTSLLGKRGNGQGRLHWSANFDEVQDFEHDIRGPFGGSGFMPDAQFNEGTRNTTLGDPKAGLSVELDALAAYVTSLDTVNPSPFRTAEGTLTESGWRGLELFTRLGCSTCHAGADFTDSAEGLLHDVGTMTALSGSRLGGPLAGVDTPTLRGVWETAPYLHDGSAATLHEVLVARNAAELHGATLNLAQQELDDLVSYLLQIDNTAREDEVGRPEPVEPEPGDGTSGDDPGALGSNAKSGGCTYSANSVQPSPLAFVGLTLGVGWAARRRRRSARR